MFYVVLQRFLEVRDIGNCFSTRLIWIDALAMNRRKSGEVQMQYEYWGNWKMNVIGFFFHKMWVFVIV